MKPIFVIGATILAAGTAFGFAKAVDQLVLPSDIATPETGLAVERSTSPVLPLSEIRKGIRPLGNDSARIRDFADIPAEPPASPDLPQTELPASEATPTASHPSTEVAALDSGIQPAAPVNYFVAPGGQDMLSGSPGTFSETGFPDETARDRFENLPMIGVYR
ncbi:hypothetical protein [Paracoccus onubensis]|uniref:DUF3035 domain-containing protein n=1 Tax=Paracoccus onubensis TaxID=1675788 RepID=A0A418T3X9_9RHOB|nr:hypothetical protein [Paracoccus onubensis]RJE87904.1 hypothetical protein D3P04_02985 [Paracoccus onubensis]